MTDAWSAYQALRDKSTAHRRASRGPLIAWLADRQHGAVASWQLVALGVTRNGIAARVKAGLLDRVHRGVHAVGGRRLDQRGRWMAAVMAGGREAVLSHRAAAACLSLIDAGPELIVVTVPGKRTRPETIRFHRSTLPADERAVCAGIPLTSAARTILDLAPTETDQRLERMIDRAERHELGDGISLPALLDRYPRRAGAPAIRRVLVARAGLTITRSELEERFLAFLGAHGFERPELNFPIRVGVHAYEFDCFWPAQRLAVELDSFSHHGGLSSFRDDRLRDRRLRTIGIETLWVTSFDLGAGAGDLDRDLRAILGGGNVS